MGSGLKKKTKYKGLNTGFMPSEEQMKWSRYCINNNIRISPVPTQRGMHPEEWRIAISVGPYKRGEKPYLSPNVSNNHQCEHLLPLELKVRKS